MKKLLLTILSLLFAFITFAQVKVRGYYRANGTYVQPHMRSSPNKDPTNNYSYPGNTNPYTGKVATGNPETYLKRYNSTSTSGSAPSNSLNSYPSSSTYSPPASTYPSTTSSSYPYSSGNLNSNNDLLKDPKPTPEELAAQRKIMDRTMNVIGAKKKYLKDAQGNYTGEYLKLSEEDESITKYTLYDVNDFPKGTLVVYPNGQRVLFDFFGKVISRSKLPHPAKRN